MGGRLARAPRPLPSPPVAGGGWGSPLVTSVHCHASGCSNSYSKMAYCRRFHAAALGARACIGCDGIRGGTLDECPWRGCPIDGRPRGLKRTSPLATPELVDVFLENTHIYESGDYESD